MKKSGQSKEQSAEAFSPHLETVIPTQQNNRTCGPTKKQVAEAFSPHLKMAVANQEKPIIPKTSPFSQQLQKEKGIIQQETKDEEKRSTTTVSQKRGKEEEKQSVISGVDSIQSVQEQQHAKSDGVSNPISVGNAERVMLKKKEQPSVHRVCAGSSFIHLKVGDRGIKARIDSGADITILSSHIYESLKEKPAKVEEVTMQMADKE